MAYVTLTFTAPINVSCQVGDIAYLVNTQTEGGFNTSIHDDDFGLLEIGDIREINDPTTNSPTIKVETTLSYAAIGVVAGEDDIFIMFTKDNRVNLSSPLGYYASVKLVNDSKSEAEMFSVGMEVFDSSSEARG